MTLPSTVVAPSYLTFTLEADNDFISNVDMVELCLLFCCAYARVAELCVRVYGYSRLRICGGCMSESASRDARRASHCVTHFNAIIQMPAFSHARDSITLSDMRTLPFC